MKERKEKDLRLKEKPLSFQPSGAVRDAGRVVRLMKDRCQRERGREQQEREPALPPPLRNRWRTMPPTLFLPLHPLSARAQARFTGL